MNNGYTTIEINGQTVGLKFAMHAIRYISEKYEQYGLGTDTTYSELALAYILNAGYLNNCRVKETIPSLTLEDFSDLVDDACFNPEKFKQIEAAIKVFEGSKFVQTTKEQTGKKKASPGMKSKVSVTES